VLERQAGMMAEDERDRAGPEQGRERRQKKYAATEKKGIEAGRGTEATSRTENLRATE